MSEKSDLQNEASNDNNGDAGEAQGQQLRRGIIRAMVQDFSPLWFTWTMNSGALALLLHQCPYRFRGIDVLADIFFVTALVTYIAFSSIFIARFIWFRWAAYEEIVNDVAELTMFSCWPIAFMTLTSAVSLIVTTAWWGGYPFSIVAYVMWWFVQTWNLCCLVWAFTTIFNKHRNYRIPASIIIPAVSVSTVGLTGAIVSAYAKDLSPTLVVPIMILSFQWTGTGIVFGLWLMSYLFHDMLEEGLPPPAATPTVFIMVGPMGQSSAALQILAAGATTLGRFGDYNSGTFITAESAKGLASACTLLALVMNGVGIIWVIFGVVIVIERAVKRELVWSPMWNAAIFPNSTLATSFIAFSTNLDSPAYRVFVAIMIIVLVILYLVNLVYTVIRVSQGRLLVVREDWRVKKALEQQKEE